MVGGLPYTGPPPITSIVGFGGAVTSFKEQLRFREIILSELPAISLGKKENSEAEGPVGLLWAEWALYPLVRERILPLSSAHTPSGAMQLLPLMVFVSLCAAAARPWLQGNQEDPQDGPSRSDRSLFDSGHPCCLIGPEIEGQVFGDLDSSKNLTISSDLPVKDMTWIKKVNGTETRLAKIKDEVLVDTLSNKYRTFNNGRGLSILNLTANDSGRYSAQMTLWDNTVITEEFDLTVREPTPPTQIITDEKNEKKTCCDILIVAFIVGAFVVLAGIVWKSICDQKSSNTTGQGDQSEEYLINQLKMWFLRIKNILQQDDGVIERRVIESNPGPAAKYLNAEKNQSSRIHLHTSSCDVPTRKEADKETAQQLQEKEEQDKLIQKK